MNREPSNGDERQRRKNCPSFPKCVETDNRIRISFWRGRKDGRKGNIVYGHPGCELHLREIMSRDADDGSFSKQASRGLGGKIRLAQMNTVRLERQRNVCAIINN